MKIVIATCLVLLASSVAAEEQQRVYQTDAYGRIQSSKPSYSVGKDGRVVEVDPYLRALAEELEQLERRAG